MLVEYWLWRYRNEATRRIATTTHHMTADEAARYPGAVRVPGSLRLRDVGELDFADTTPRVFRPEARNS